MEWMHFEEAKASMVRLYNPKTDSFPGLDHVKVSDKNIYAVNSSREETTIIYGKYRVEKETIVPIWTAYSSVGSSMISFPISIILTVLLNYILRKITVKYSNNKNILINRLIATWGVSILIFILLCMPYWVYL